MPTAAFDTVSARSRVPAWAGWLIAAITFVGMAPTLGWLEFSNGIEQLHTATVLEMRRDGGSWLLPTLNGALRIKKPPLPAWIGALAVDDATVAAASSNDRNIRDDAFKTLAWQIRWPALLAGCLMLVATFDLGSTIGGRKIGLAAAVIAATSLLFLRYMRLASTDVHLALWVAVANALLARVMVRRQRWWLIGAGAAIGAGVMCKGPVALLQTLAPLLVTWAWFKWKHRRSAGDDVGSALRTSSSGEPTVRSADPTRSGLLTPIAFAVVAFLAVALPWPILVATSHEGALAIWWAEITREGATDHEYGPLWSYLSLIPNLLPWLPAFVVGLVLTMRKTSGNPPESPAAPPRENVSQADNAPTSETDLKQISVVHSDPTDTGTKVPAPASNDRDVTNLKKAVDETNYLYTLFWLLVPIIVMSLVRDKSERYLLPMLPAAAILSARGLLALIADMRQGSLPARIWLIVQCSIVGVMGVALAVAGSMPSILDRVDGSAWYAAGLAIPLALTASGLLAASIVLLARRPAVAVGLMAVVMLGTNALFLWGYKDSSDGRSEMKPIADRILAHQPSAVVAYEEPSKPMPPDLAIYLNRAVRTWDGMKKRGMAQPDVLVTLQREREAEPQIQGWKTFAAEPYRGRYWHAMEREKAGEPATRENALQ